MNMINVFLLIGLSKKGQKVVVNLRKEVDSLLSMFIKEYNRRRSRNNSQCYK